MYNTPKLAAEKLTTLELPQIFEKIWRFEGPRKFCLQWCRPSEYFNRYTEIKRLCPRIAGCIPLLESNCDRVIVYDECSSEYLLYYYGKADCSVVGNSYQQMLSWVFVDMGYGGLVNVVEDVAADFGYRHLESWREFMLSDEEESERELSADELRDKFVRSIGD